MARWLSPNAQILILLLSGLIITVMEAMYSNLRSNISEVWKLNFPEDLYSPGFENILKTIIFVIILIRGTTIHIFLASYLLLIIPVIKERMRLVIIIWLAISGFRSIIVNLVATMVGIFICVSLPQAHPACFNFVGAKGFELACSAFMWVLVNDFMHYIGRTNIKIRKSIDEQISIPRTSLSQKSLESWQFDDLAKTSTLEEVVNDDDDDDDSSSDDLFKTVSDTLWNIKKKQRQGVSVVEDNETRIAKAAVSKFFENSFGLKFVGSDPFNEEDEVTAEFLNHHKEDIENLILTLKNFVKRNSSKGKCIHKNCYHCIRKQSKRNTLKAENVHYNYFRRSNLEFPPTSENQPPKEFLVKLNGYQNKNDEYARLPFTGMGETTESLLSLLQNLEKSNSNLSINTSKMDVCSKPTGSPRDSEIQTDPVSNRTLRKIESQENKFLNKL